MQEQISGFMEYIGFSFETTIRGQGFIEHLGFRVFDSAGIIMVMGVWQGLYKF